MKLNKRGFFRVWLVTSAIWVAAVVYKIISTFYLSSMLLLLMDPLFMWKEWGMVLALLFGPPLAIFVIVWLIYKIILWLVKGFRTETAS